MVVSLLLSPPVSPSPAKHSLEGQRRDVQLVPARLHAEAGATCMWPGTNTPFVAPRPCFLLIRPTDRRRHGDSKLGGSSGRAAWGLGRRGGRALSASGRGSEPRTCAQAQRGRSGQSAGGWSRRCHPLPERDAGAAGSQAHGLRGGKDRTVAVSSACIITPSPGSSPSLPRPSPTPRVSRTRIRARPGPCLPTSALAIPGGGLQPPRSNRRPWPRLHV